MLKGLRQSVVTAICSSWSPLTFICHTVEIKPVILSIQTQLFALWIIRADDREGKFVHAEMTDKQVHLANRLPRWVWESGNCSLFKGLVPFHTTGILLPGVQITLFFKQFSMTCLTSSHCFQALFSHTDLADYIRKLQTIWKFDSNGNVEHTHTNMHTSLYLSWRELHNTKSLGKRKREKKWQSRKQVWQLTFWLINCSRIQETLKIFLEATSSSEKSPSSRKFHKFASLFIWKPPHPHNTDKSTSGTSHI